MKLSSAHVTNYRSILDSNSVKIGQSTCLVGKNEAGKTAFLKALEGINSTDRDYNSYNKTENYPRRFLAEYAERHGDGEAKVVVTRWELEDKETALLIDEFGADVVTGNEVAIEKSYGQKNTTWNVPIDERKLIAKLIIDFELDEADAKNIKDCTNTFAVAYRLSKMDERSEGQQHLLDAIKKYRGESASNKAIDILTDKIPKFLYFSHYDRMSGEVSINQLAHDKQHGGIKDGDQVFLDFLEYAGTNLDELTSATKFEEMNAKCEAAANRITDQIFEYWTQNDQLEIDVRLDEGKKEDPAPFNSGPVARARVKNNLHRVTVPFSERSAGFIWFFSFLVKFAQIKKHQGDVIILLDEPGLTLHGTAQKDLLRYFREELEPKHQIIFSTHSPFMVPAENLASVRTVEDVVKRDKRDRSYSEGTKIRPDVLTTDPQTNFPVFGAMGFEVTQGLIISPNTLLVEGPSDILYLQALSKKLQLLGRPHLDPKWAICPSGGIDKVLPFVKLFYGNKLNVAVMTDFDRGQRRKLDDLYKAELLERERIILATEIANQDEADTEDFFDTAFFVNLINATYDLKGKDRLSAMKLNEADERSLRAVKKAEAYFRLLPDTIPTFSHYDPAYHLLTHPELLDENDKSVQRTLDTFQVAIERINAHI
ncbi:ATP-dependent endonuclease [Paracoccus gahaiensis]|uniref:ATP-dependent endonuclease n=1 Tax=Paracoccus gahaiensis TaxID=1706839 RepID=A0A4U0R3S1_9RHOB|nr:AAA family ATPase [Paracoccus gahaiensis]TJZ89449.1 ATP-dependent endonuclease [Paracoccus gahaiensis]